MKIGDVVRIKVGDHLFSALEKGDFSIICDIQTNQDTLEAQVEAGADYQEQMDYFNEHATDGFVYTLGDGERYTRDQFSKASLAQFVLWKLENK